MKIATTLAGLTCLLVGVTLLISTYENEDAPRFVSETSSVVATAPSTIEAMAVTPEPEPTILPTAEPSNANVTRLIIPRIGVDAPAIELGVDPDGAMQSPKNPTDVAWYRFSSKPGNPGNVVVAGHVDYYNYGAAVFWSLRELRDGDEVMVQTDDGRAYGYRVVSVTAYDEATAPVAEIVGPTTNEVLTLITCTGTFIRSVREYDKRLVVRAERFL